VLQHDQRVMQSVGLDVVELAPELDRGPPLLTVLGEDLQNDRPLNDLGVIDLASTTLIRHGRNHLSFSCNGLGRGKRRAEARLSMTGVTAGHRDLTQLPGLGDVVRDERSHFAIAALLVQVVLDCVGAALALGSRVNDPRLAVDANAI
jgi:hypothetical protein